MSTERDLMNQLRAVADSVAAPAELEMKVKREYERWVNGRDRQKHRPRTILLSSIASLTVLAGGTIAWGYASPQVARVLQRIPVINGVADALFAGANPGVEQAVKDGFNIPINKSITHDGVTITATNAYFGPDQLWIGLTQTFAKNLKVHPRVRLAKMELDINGRQVMPVQSEFRPVKNGSYVGDIGTFSLPKDVPNSITATVTLHKIGEVVSNAWTITMKLSRSVATAATKAISERATRSVDGTSWAIHQVELTPAEIDIAGEITTLGTVQPNFAVVPTSLTSGWMGAPIQNVTRTGESGGSTRWSFTATFDRPAKMGSSVTLEPVFDSSFWMVPVPKASAKFGPSTFTFFPGTTDQFSVTGTTVSRTAVRVDYTTVGNQYEKNNFYHLALQGMRQGSAQPVIHYPTEFRVVSAAKHEAELVFKVPTGQQALSLVYMPKHVTVDRHGERSYKTIVIHATRLKVTVPLR